MKGLSSGSTLGSFQHKAGSYQTEAFGNGSSSGSISGCLVPLCRLHFEAQEYRRSGWKPNAYRRSAVGWAGRRSGPLCRRMTPPLWEGIAPALERLPSSRKSRVCPRSAAGSGCLEAEALAELAPRPPTTMSTFDTNPFADPVDVNPFQVELPAHSSL